MVRHLRYSLMTAGMSCKETRHAQIVMKELGITYQHSVPQSMSDSWEFWNCENLPDNLPEYLKLMDRDPMKRIGRGLSEEDAKKIRDYKEGE